METDIDVGIKGPEHKNHPPVNHRAHSRGQQGQEDGVVHDSSRQERQGLIVEDRVMVNPTVQGKNVIGMEGGAFNMAEVSQEISVSVHGIVSMSPGPRECK